MKGLNIKDPELLRWVCARTGYDLGYASNLLTVIKRYLDGKVTKEDIDRFEKLGKKVEYAKH